MTLKLEGKIAFITGGGAGIGLAAAKEFLQEGATLAIMARSQEKADDAIREIGGDTIAVIGDVTSLVSIQHCINEVYSQLGKIDILFANAGIGGITPIGETDEALFDSLCNTNFKGVYYTINYAYPHLNDGASVIITSSIASDLGIEALSIYSATKAAVRSLARTLTPELAKINARINVLSPGPIYTDILKSAGVEKDDANAMVNGLAKAGAINRVGEPEEMAKVALFLASDDSSYLYGSDIQADGGINQMRFTSN